MGMEGIESMFDEGMRSVVGDPTFIGLLIWIFFGGFVMLQNTRIDVKMAIMVPATFLAMAFFPTNIPMILFGLFCSFILYFAAMRVFGK